MSRIKAEVPYDMSKSPPAPVMSRKEPERPSRGKHPKGSRAPDVIIVKDPSKPPTQDNLEEVIEVKFPGDNYREGQEAAYDKIAGPARFETFDPERCGCPNRKQEQQEERRVTAEDVAEAVLLTLLVIVLIVDDVAPGGQLDDAAIPPVIARIMDRLAPLLRGPVPVVP
jgi:type VI secretion system secreted protein VgrG